MVVNSKLAYKVAYDNAKAIVLARAIIFYTPHLALTQLCPNLKVIFSILICVLDTKEKRSKKKIHI